MSQTSKWLTVTSKHGTQNFLSNKISNKSCNYCRSAYEAIKGARNVVHAVVLPSNTSDSGNQESNTKKVSPENMKEIYEPVEELEIEKVCKTLILSKGFEAMIDINPPSS